ncbi:hypothetical protein [Rhizorhabdus histidinilytica]|uniref:hypothetical protein n=1 Tax=Rhizorhabdus histidinilytica TaxID=439228 RepID=UPI0032203202
MSGDSTDEIVAGMAARAAARGAAMQDVAGAAARLSRVARSLPRYVQAKKLARDRVAYYWTVPPSSRPDIKVRSLALGADRDAAVAIANRMLTDADAALAKTGQRGLAHRTELARRFAALDALSRERTLTSEETDELEQVMVDLGMIQPEGDE